MARLGGIVVALVLLLLAVTPAAADAPYPPGISTNTLRTAALGTATLAAGGGHSCARTSLGDLYCWGDDSSGQLGDGSAAHAFGRPVRALRGVLRVDAGKAHTCAITVGGTASCWGDNSAGQLGDGTYQDRDAPVAVKGLGGRALVDIATGVRHSCAVDDQGAAWCWGNGARGQLGVPGLRGSATPVRVSTGSGMGAPVVDIAAGRDSSCAVTTAGTAYCWGSDPGEKLGDSSEPVAVGVAGAKDIVVGGNQACTLEAKGSAYCWGRGSGELKKAFGALTAGGEHACGLDDGRAYCWGEGADGRLGNGRSADKTAPVPVKTGTQLRELDAGDEHSCALDVRGITYCWGAGADGQLGTGSSGPSAVPVPVEGLPRPPAAVTGVRALALDGGLRVSWQPPADVGTSEFLYLWATTADYVAGCTLTDVTATGCELTGLRNDRPYDVAIVVRTRDGLTISDLATATPVAVAPLPTATSAPSPATTEVLAGAGGGLPLIGISPIALAALGMLLLGGGLAVLLVRRS